MNRDCLNNFLKRFGTNAPEALEILGLVLKARTKMRIVDKSMLMYTEQGVFIREGLREVATDIYLNFTNQSNCWDSK